MFKGLFFLFESSSGLTTTAPSVGTKAGHPRGRVSPVGTAPHLARSSRGWRAARRTRNDRRIRDSYLGGATRDSPSPAAKRAESLMAASRDPNRGGNTRLARAGTTPARERPVKEGPRNGGRGLTFSSGAAVKPNSEKRRLPSGLSLLLLLLLPPSLPPRTALRASPVHDALKRVRRRKKVCQDLIKITLSLRREQMDPGRDRKKTRAVAGPARRSPVFSNGSEGMMEDRQLDTRALGDPSRSANSARV